jgi:hypothetical protein
MLLRRPSSGLCLLVNAFLLQISLLDSADRYGYNYFSGDPAAELLQ